MAVSMALPLSLALSSVISVTCPSCLTPTVAPKGEFPRVQKIGQARRLHADNDALRALALIRACPGSCLRVLAFAGKNALHCIDRNAK